MFSSFPLLKLISGKMHWRHLDLETFYWGMPWIPLDFMHYVLQSFFDFYNFVWAFCCTFKIVPTNSSQNKKVFSWLGLVLDWSSKKWGSWINQGSIKSLDFFITFIFCFIFMATSQPEKIRGWRCSMNIWERKWPRSMPNAPEKRYCINIWNAYLLF